jgi:phospholipid/cholesterol/gamma-HCH transport system substrate-binding protein
VFVIVAVAIFVVAVLQAGVLKDAFKSVATLRVILPDEGLSGLARGSTVEILGTPAGKVDRIVINPDEKLQAEVEIDAAMKPFVRRDSKAFIRRQFGIAGAAYLEISRGTGPPLDWDYAVLTVEVDRDPTANIGDLVDEVRAKVFPILDDTHRTIRSLAGLADRLGGPGGEVDQLLTSIGVVSERLARGEGTVGRLLVDDRLAQDVEETMAALNREMGQIGAILADVRTATSEVAAMSRTVSGQSQTLITNTGDTLVSLNAVLKDVSKTMPALTKLMTNAGDASVALPTFLVQTQKSLEELERLLRQLQGHWLLGGRTPPPESPRLSPLEARP